MENPAIDAVAQVSAARVPTRNGARYVEQLCRPSEHRLDVRRSPDGASITLPSGALVLLAASADALDVTVTASDLQRLTEAQEVVQVHLDRFAFSEAPLRYK